MILAVFPVLGHHAFSIIPFFMISIIGIIIWFAAILSSVENGVWWGIRVLLCSIAECSLAITMLCAAFGTEQWLLAFLAAWAAIASITGFLIAYFAYC